MTSKGRGVSVPTYSPTVGARKSRASRDSKDGLRVDGRNPHQCRPAFMRTGAVNAAVGSAYAEFGSTKVIVSVFGPRESKKAMAYSDVGRLNCSVSFMTFSTQIRGQGSEDKEMSSMLHKALEGAIMLETFPKTTVDVFALVMESGGGDLPVIISCASLALADAGIKMLDLVTSTSLSCHGMDLVIDPTLEEERCQDGGFMISFMPSRNEVTQLAITGEWSTAKVAEAMELCIDACLKLGNVMRECLKAAATSVSE
ncbi:exosome complex component RRP41-like [Nymphaea colorata]|nr:exosome complex component RRP41-like [Nymphaea colorata]XP_031502966.1 exosome complex component RRP41-like [Nymphaea colorata]XP_049936930.1 exosome complex component RRP41-like [Nymphaea colorata]